MIIESFNDILPILGIMSVVLGGIIWIIKAQISMSKEFKPNHGGSLRDSVDRLERDTRDIRSRVDQHIDTHNKGG
jgi:hypothetical protein